MHYLDCGESFLVATKGNEYEVSFVVRTDEVQVPLVHE